MAQAWKWHMWLFYPYCIGQNSVMWHDLITGEAGKCSPVKGQGEKMMVC